MPPTRKKLPHDVPAWVSNGSSYFLTINCAIRGGDVLGQAGRAEALLASRVPYEDAGKWFVHILMVMPDHVHLIAAFDRTPGLRATIGSWKAYHAKTLGIVWQKNFFEHRLRDEAAFAEKIHYVRMNPVRKGLVADWRQWPFVFVRGDWPEANVRN